jgi:hypothetical protein
MRAITMSQIPDPSRDLLFGLLALQNGLIDQGGLFTAFAAWTRDKGRPLADHLVARGDLDPDDRDVVSALVVRHLTKHGGDPEKSLAAINTDRSTRESLARLGDIEIEASITHIGIDAPSTRAGKMAIGQPATPWEPPRPTASGFRCYGPTRAEASALCSWRSMPSSIARSHSSRSSSAMLTIL